VSKGVASSRGAMTILNAIPTGIGAALGITLQTDAEVSISDGKPGIRVSLPERGEDDCLAKECVEAAFKSACRELSSVKVRTKSTIPISRGLKSSSAAANAVTLAAVRALDIEMDDVEIVKMGVAAARRANVTVTGAFDDAMACYFGGVAVTNNTEMEVIKRATLKKRNLRVILHVPEQKIRKAGLSRNTFKPLFKKFKEVEELVLDGDYFEAIDMNGELIAESLGIDNGVAERAIKSGAVAAGITGTGPATAILCREDSFERLLDSVSRKHALIITAHLNETPAPEVESRL
jgi:shikimate kinase